MPAELSDSVLEHLSEQTLTALGRLTRKRRQYVLALAVPESPSFGRSRESAESVGFADPMSAVERMESSDTVRLAILSTVADLKHLVEPYTVADAAWIQRRLSVWAESTILDFGTVDADGLFQIDLSEVVARPDIASRIEAIEVKHTPWGPVQKLKLVSPAKVIELLGRHTDVGAWRDVVELQSGDRAERIQRAALRAIEAANATTVEVEPADTKETSA